jgi:FADH2 O2-dependent halogenase
LEGAVSSEKYDVAILGSGLGGSILATILSRLGLRVLVLERRGRPRPSVGESMPRRASLILWLLGHQLDVPEILDLSSTDRLSERVVATCGARRSYGFLYHEPGRRPAMDRARLVVPPELPFCSESHLFRQDVDLHLIAAARRYGATYRERAPLAGVEPGRDGVVLRCADGRRVSARFVIDDSGRDSRVAARLGLGLEAPPLRTRTRSLHAEVKGLRRYDEILAESELAGLEPGWFQGTLHHAFDGGTFWAIPFDNHEGSINPLASVGLTLDLARFPRRGLTPEAEVREVAAQYPAIAAHFEGAVPVRPWVATERLQFAASTCLAERCVLLPGSAAFVDRFYGGDLGATCETLYALLSRLVAALEADDFAVARFEDVERQRAARIGLADRWMAASLKASAHFETWSAWQRVWLADTERGEARWLELASALAQGGEASRESRDEEPGLDPALGTLGDETGPLARLVEPGEALMNGVAQGMIKAECAARQVLDLLGEVALPPIHPRESASARLPAASVGREGGEGELGEAWSSAVRLSSALKTKRPLRFPEAAPS